MRYPCSGFTLAEILPAALVLVTCLLAGFRFLHLSLASHERSGDFAISQAAFERVREAWSAGQGTVAITVLKDGGQWEVYEFPDLSWLPLAGSDDHGDSSTILWKRTVREEVKRSFRLWDVEKRASGALGWQWWTAFMEWKRPDGKPH